MSRDELAGLQRLTQVSIAGAIRFRGSGQITDPTTLGSAKRCTRVFVRWGGREHHARADIVLIAAGAASAPSFARLGIAVPLIAERGYHIESAATEWPADTPPLVFEDRSMIVTRFAHGLRTTSFVEFAHAALPPDPRSHIRALDGLARPGIPDLAELNPRLEAATGWRTVAVPGVIPNHVFFRHLSERRFPAANFLRAADSLDYSGPFRRSPRRMWAGCASICRARCAHRLSICLSVRQLPAQLLCHRQLRPSAQGYSGDRFRPDLSGASQPTAAGAERGMRWRYAGRSQPGSTGHAGHDRHVKLLRRSRNDEKRDPSADQVLNAISSPSSAGTSASAAWTCRCTIRTAG